MGARPTYTARHSIGDRSFRATSVALAKDPYAALGVSKDANKDDVKKAYYKLVKKCVLSMPLQCGSAACGIRGIYIFTKEWVIPLCPCESLPSPSVFTHTALHLALR